MIRPGIIAANRRRGGGPPPGPTGHRYWRALFQAQTPSTGRVGLSEFEFLAKRYYEPATGTFSSSGSLSTAVDETYLPDGNFGGSSSFGFWQSNTAATPIWYQVDAGIGNEFVCEGVMMTRGNITTGDLPASAQIQWSDDGSSWTTEWTEADLFTPLSAQAQSSSFAALSRIPRIFDNPNVTFTAGSVAPSFNQSNVLLWLKSYDGAFSDNLTTPATNGDPVQTMTNHNTVGSIAIAQSVLARRPIFRTGGAGGMPYLEFDPADQRHFEDFAFTLNAGSTDMTPGRFGILADVNVPSTPTILPVFGNGASDSRKNRIHIRSNAGSQFFLHNWGAFTLSNGIQTLAAGYRTFNSNSAVSTVENDAGWASPGNTYPSTAITSSEFFRHTGGTTDYWFNGKVYEVILIQDTLTDSNLMQRDAFRIQQYLLGRSLLGA